MTGFSLPPVNRMVLDMSKPKKYEVRSTGVEVVTVTATDSRDARRKAASLIRKQTGMDYKDSALTATCLEGQPAKAPPSTSSKAPAKQVSAEIPSIQTVVVWVLYYVNKGIEWMNKN